MSISRSCPPSALSPHSRLIMTYALCGFANFGSLGILIGGMGAMVPERRPEIVALGLRSILSGTLATCMSRRGRGHAAVGLYRHRHDELLGAFARYRLAERGRAARVEVEVDAVLAEPGDLPPAARVAHHVRSGAATNCRDAQSRSRRDRARRARSAPEIRSASSKVEKPRRLVSRNAASMPIAAPVWRQASVRRWTIAASANRPSASRSPGLTRPRAVGMNPAMLAGSGRASGAGPSQTPSRPAIALRCSGVSAPAGNSQRSSIQVTVSPFAEIDKAMAEAQPVTHRERGALDVKAAAGAQLAGEADIEMAGKPAAAQQLGEPEKLGEVALGLAQAGRNNRRS